ncbi:MAG: hypothetical protein R3B09_18070 [Nannocystaceae bacterium]
MPMRTDPEESFGRIGLPEVHLDPPVRGLLAALDRGALVPVTIDGEGVLVGELELGGGATFLPEPHPDGRSTRGWVDVVGLRALQWSTIGLLVGGAVYLLVDALGLIFLLLVTAAFWPLLYLVATQGGRGRLWLRPPPTTRGGNPGLLLLGEALVVRRHGVCDVFPRRAVVAITEVERSRPGAPGEPPVRYAITQIAYRGLHGQSTYTLDVGAPIGARATVPIDGLRAARLRRVRAWLDPSGRRAMSP